MQNAVRRSDTRETIENLQSAVRPIQSHLVFGAFLRVRESGYRTRGKSTPLELRDYRDITAGIRAIGTAHCYNRATMHRLAKCRYESCDQKIGKQRGNKREEEKERIEGTNGLVLGTR